LKDFILIIISVLLSSVAQMFLKLGMTKVGRISDPGEALTKLPLALLNPFVLGGLFIFGISALSWLVVLSRVKLNIAYPMVSLGYVAVIIFSWLILKEPLKPSTIAGCVTVIIGLFLISRGL
jgi:drug/metabolite transporter (DMT)-like permease